MPHAPSTGSLGQVVFMPGARRIEAQNVVPSRSPDVYAFYRGATQRNLYRIPIQ